MDFDLEYFPIEDLDLLSTEIQVAGRSDNVEFYELKSATHSVRSDDM